MSKKSLSEIKEYCSWNNIPYTTSKKANVDYSDWEAIPDFMEETILIDLKYCIGGTYEGLLKFMNNDNN